MIDLTNRTIIMAGTVRPIKGFAVWFMTPFGITPDLEEGVKRCQASDVDPEININPVPVAICDDGTYELFFPRR